VAYRDAHGRAVTEQDWANIEAQLPRAHQLLKVGVAAD
jgi:hypothetical protein